MKRDIPSRTPGRVKQVTALAKARSWRGNFKAVKNAVLEAAAAYPISDLQWFNLSVEFGPYTVEKLKSCVREARS